MVFSTIFTLLLQQATPAPDTIVARMIAERGVLDWTSGILQLVVLTLGVGTLATMVALLITVRRGVMEASTVLKQFAVDTKPIIASATDVVTDAREVVAMLRTDVERVTGAAGVLSDQLLSAARITTERVDNVNAVLDVLQQEMEDTAISAAAAMRGVRAGTRALSGRGHRKRRRPSEPDAD